VVIEINAARLFLSGEAAESAGVELQRGRAVVGIQVVPAQRTTMSWSPARTCCSDGALLQSA
jgi:hypothetical protein